jgi:hypothetical protein
MRRLVESWVAAELSYGNTPATALRQLNESLGTKYTHSRLSQWRRGVYTPAPAVLSRMLFRTLAWAIDEVGIEASDEQLLSLDRYFWNLAEAEGDGSVELL